MKTSCLILAAGAATVSLAMAAHGATLLVKPSGGGGYVTIQSAIAAASPGDLIIVDPGVYDENLMLGKDIQFISALGGSRVIVNGRALGSVLSCNSNVTSATTFTDFGFINGRSYLGGGAALWGASPAFFNCDFVDNTATQHGGGVWSSGDPLFVDCEFRLNEAAGEGGGMCLVNASSRIENSTFESNSAAMGGGVVANNAALQIVSSSIRQNTSIWGGGGVASLGSTLDLEDTQLEANSSSHGGSLYSFNATCNVRSCTFRSGSATRWGGHIVANQSSLDVDGTMFEHGQADERGGMLYLSDCNWTGRGNTFLDGDAPGGAMVWAAGSDLGLDGSLFDGSVSMGHPLEYSGRAIRLESCQFEAVDSEFRALMADEPNALSLIHHGNGTATYRSCTIAQCFIRSLVASGSDRPAIVQNSNSTISMSDCLVASNNSGSQGNTIGNRDASLFVKDCTFKHNGAPSFGSFSKKRSRNAVICRQSPYRFTDRMVITNSLFCSNTIRDMVGRISSRWNTFSRLCP